MQMEKGKSQVKQMFVTGFLVYPNKCNKKEITSFPSLFHIDSLGHESQRLSTWHGSPWQH